VRACCRVRRPAGESRCDHALLFAGPAVSAPIGIEFSSLYTSACSNNGNLFGGLRRREAATFSHNQSLQLRPQTGMDVQRPFIGYSVNSTAWQARGPDRSEFRHEKPTDYCTRYGSCSWHRQHFGGHELCLQIQPSLMVRSDFQHTSPCKGRLVRLITGPLAIVNDR
jgi:hypothetical protein